MTDPLLQAKIVEVELEYASQYGSPEQVPDWLIVRVLNAPSDEYPPAPSVVSATLIRNILVKNSDYAKIQIQSENSEDLVKRERALSALAVVNLIGQIDFNVSQILNAFQTSMQLLMQDEVVSLESANEINGLIYQLQSWAQYHSILVDPTVIAEARSK